MDQRTTELVAIGAAAAVNCQACLRYHVDAGGRAGVDAADISEAVDVGLLVNQGAAGQSRSFSDGVLAELGVDRGTDDAAPPASCCG